jgi:uncharacterized surface protein with fasciclin (FAS1) repeats
MRQPITLRALTLAAAGLAPLLSAPGVKTVFAPTNDAFGALGNNTLAWITNDRNQQELLNVLYYHFTAGAVTTDVLSKVSTLPTFDQGASGAEVGFEVHAYVCVWFACG